MPPGIALAKQGRKIARSSVERIVLAAADLDARGEALQVARCLSKAFSSGLREPSPMPLGTPEDPHSALGIVSGLGPCPVALAAYTAIADTSSAERVIGCVLGAILDDEVVDRYGLAPFAAMPAVSDCSGSRADPRHALKVLPLCGAERTRVQGMSADRRQADAHRGRTEPQAIATGGHSERPATASRTRCPAHSDPVNRIRDRHAPAVQIMNLRQQHIVMISLSSYPLRHRGSPLRSLTAERSRSLGENHHRSITGCTGPDERCTLTFTRFLESDGGEQSSVYASCNEEKAGEVPGGE